MSTAFLEGSRPSIVYFLADDWPHELWPNSTSDDTENYTALLPSITRHFVDDGLRLDNHYFHKISSPSRRALLSGRFVSTLGTPSGDKWALSAAISTLGDRMTEAGYSTAFFGKWFLGFGSPSLLPARRGFAHSVGFFSQSIDQYGWNAKWRGALRTSSGEDIYDLLINEERITREHPYIVAGQGKLRYEEDGEGGAPTTRLRLFEEADHLNAAGLLQAQAADEEGRHFSQDVLDTAMVRVLETAAPPLFVLMSTAGLHEPLDSRHHQRLRVFEARASRLAAAAGCPWHEAWAVQANPSQCDDDARAVRFEREAMALGIDDSVGLAAEALKARGEWNRTLLVFASDNGTRRPGRQRQRWCLLALASSPQARKRRHDVGFPWAARLWALRVPHSLP